MAATPQSTPQYGVEGPGFNRFNVDQLGDVVIGSDQPSNGTISHNAQLYYDANTSQWQIRNTAIPNTA
jgi:hypothetical protein